ncbi:MAG TPA: NifU N-terminal domain-containing protein [Acidimicrobiia bacterium]|nr:NifU N-terminal domain-containing protein [Acidimicrobiia bacterium]
MITVDPTPNPNAVKFSVGRPVGGPATFVPGKPVDDPMAAALLGLAGVTSVFMTADFVTISKSPDADWEQIVPPARQILEDRFGAEDGTGSDA